MLFFLMYIQTMDMLNLYLSMFLQQVWKWHISDFFSPVVGVDGGTMTAKWDDRLPCHVWGYKNRYFKPKHHRVFPTLNKCYACFMPKPNQTNNMQV